MDTLISSTHAAQPLPLVHEASDSSPNALTGELGDLAFELDDALDEE